MKKYKETTFKIEAKLREILREEHTDEEDNLETGESCEPFFISSLLALTMLHNGATGNVVDPLEMTHIYNKLAVQLTIDESIKGWVNAKCAKSED